MSILTKTDAIVLKSMKYSDTSKIVTLYTREFGSLRCIAKGARANRNKFGAALEPMTYAGLLLYKKENRELHLLSQADIIQTWKRITGDLNRLSLGLSLLELLYQVSREEERNVPLFDLAVDALRAIDTAESPGQPLLHAFELRLASLFGYPPQVDLCDVCGRQVADFPKSGTLFVVSRGCLVCGACSHEQGMRPSAISPQMPIHAVSAVSISDRGVKDFRRLAGADWVDLTSNPITEDSGNEIDEILRFYIRYHFVEIKPSRTAELFRVLKS